MKKNKLFLIGYLVDLFTAIYFAYNLRCLRHYQKRSIVNNNHDIYCCKKETGRKKQTGDVKTSKLMIP